YDEFEPALDASKWEKWEGELRPALTARQMRGGGSAAPQAGQGVSCSISVRPLQAEDDDSTRRQRRMMHDVALFLRTHADEFLRDFPEYGRDEMERIIDRVRRGADDP
ncbi:MAG: hypothetical protein ACOYIH_08210, partial [Candidatus Fimadaptatus sp.]